MNYKKITKFLLFFCIALTMSFVLSLESFASDYKYKVLDPKYNPSAQDLIEGKLSSPTDEYLPVPTSKKFDFKVLFAAAALIIFPTVIFYVAAKALKQVSNTSESENQTIGNITISKKDEEDNIENPLQNKCDNEDEDNTSNNINNLKAQECESENQTIGNITISKKDEEDNIENPLQNKCDNEDEDNSSNNINNLKAQECESEKQNIKSDSAIIQEEIKTVKNIIPSKPKEIRANNKHIDETVKQYFTSPISKIPNPMLLNTAPLGKNKGFCIVEYNKKYSLIGYINNEIFMLDQFENLKNYEIRSRLTESQNSKDRYIVRFGEYKALVEVSEANMSLLLEL